MSDTVAFWFLFVPAGILAWLFVAAVALFIIGEVIRERDQIQYEKKRRLSAPPSED